jgi:hypothetical protein
MELPGKDCMDKDCMDHRDVSLQRCRTLKPSAHGLLRGSLIPNPTHTHDCTANVSLVPISMRFIKRLALLDQDQRSLLTRNLL